jgi:hypothetical protein
MRGLRRQTEVVRNGWKESCNKAHATVRREQHRGRHGVPGIHRRGTRRDKRARPDAERSSRLVDLAYLGAIALTVGMLSLGVGLLRAA